jgi:hypothetical protein
MLSPNENWCLAEFPRGSHIRIAEYVRDFNRYGDPSFYMAIGKNKCGLIVNLAVIRSFAMRK